MPTPTISIIVPVYNAEKYLHRCLDSIVAQIFTDWECILIDDGSPDDSGKICDEYAAKDGRFRVFHQENAGVSAARNKGLNEARGEWIGFVDSDDWTEEDMLQKLYDCVIKNGADVAVSGCIVTDGIKKRKIFQVNNGRLEIPEDFEWFIQGPWAKLFKKDILLIHNIKFPLGVTLAEDLYFVFQVFVHSDSIWGSNCVSYNYFDNKESITNNISQKDINNHAFVINRIETDLRNLNIFDKRWLRWLNQKKSDVKNLCIYNSSEPDFNLWWKVYPEVSYDLESESSLKRMFVKILILLRLNKLSAICLKYTK